MASDNPVSLKLSLKLFGRIVYFYTNYCEFETTLKLSKFQESKLFQYVIGD